jgi:hypothetical protein
MAYNSYIHTPFTYLYTPIGQIYAVLVFIYIFVQKYEKEGGNENYLLCLRFLVHYSMFNESGSLFLVSGWYNIHVLCD